MNTIGDKPIGFKGSICTLMRRFSQINGARVGVGPDSNLFQLRYCLASFGRPILSRQM